MNDKDCEEALKGIFKIRSRLSSKSLQEKEKLLLKK